jgi:hypothetical protein
MNTAFAIVVIAFVVIVLGLVGYVLFEMTPLARHADHYRDPRTGKRRFRSPRLD